MDALTRKALHVALDSPQSAVIHELVNQADRQGMDVNDLISSNVSSRVPSVLEDRLWGALGDALWRVYDAGSP